MPCSSTSPSPTTSPTACGRGSGSDRPDKATIAQKVGSLLDLIKLGGLADRYPSQLSGGQRQRVALARALAVEPRVLLLDEPFGALDAQVRKDLRRWLRDIHDRTGQTTIFVTHDQDEALELADRVAILNKGHLEQIGTPDEVQDSPVSASVLLFLGDTIEIAASLVAGRVIVAGHATPVAAAGRADGPVTLYVRPWQVALTAADAPVHLQGHIRNLYKSNGRLRVDVEGTIASGFTIEVPTTAPVAIGAPIALTVTGGTVF